MHNYGSRAVRALPLVIGLAAGLATLVLWRALDERETRAHDEILEARAVAVRTEIEARVRMPMLALLRMANRWQIRGELVGSQWLPDAELYVRHDPAYRALVWLDRRWSPRLWVERTATHPIVRGTGPNVSPWIASVLSHCRSEPAAQTLCRPTSGGVLLVINPVVTDGRTIGFFVGMFDLQALLGGSLETNVLPDSAVVVAEGDSTIFQRGTPAGAHLSVATSKAAVPIMLPGVTWRVLVGWAPGADPVSPLPRVALGGGLLISVLLAVLVRLAQTARRREEVRVAHAERQRDTLVREVHHRINNNLQGVMSLLRQHIRAHPDMREVLVETIAQVYAVATIHGLQGRGRGREVRLGELVSAIADGARSMRASAPLVVSKLAGAEAIAITEAEAVPVALVINELVLNAIKHMDRAVSGGRIEIVFERSAQGAILRIGNPARGLPAGFDFGAGRGLGTGLGLVKSLMPPRGASLAIGYTGTEVEATLTLAAPVVVERTAAHESNTPGPAHEHQTVAAWKSEES